MKKTHKLKALGDVAGVMAAAPNLSVAARRLGVNRSTLHRWLQAGKVQRAEAKTGVAAGAKADETPEGWARAVRETGNLDATQGVLVDLAAAALTLARSGEQPAVRLSAMGRYQQLVRQLNLPALDGQGLGTKPASESRPAAPRRAGADPRAVFMVVK